VAWRDDLTPQQQAKIADELVQWLDGVDAGSLGILEYSPGTAAIWANLLRELPPDRTEEFIALGLDAEEYMLAIPGNVGRDQLVVVARHPDIIGLAPIRGSEPGAGPSTPPPAPSGDPKDNE
jgi:hypothetical protein